MNSPTIREAIDQLREHYGLSMAETLALVRTPLHPRELRDEFALAALNGVLSTAGGQDLTHEERTAWCYREADAMLEARNANR